MKPLINASALSLFALLSFGTANADTIEQTPADSSAQNKLPTLTVTSPIAHSYRPEYINGAINGFTMNNRPYIIQGDEAYHNKSVAVDGDLFHLVTYYNANRDQEFTFWVASSDMSKN